LDPFTADKNLDAKDVDLLAQMIEHMALLQAGLERIVYFDKSINYEEFFR
jgi:hypothetical protein